MLCYTCESGPHPGGMRLDIPDAVGICHDCGIGVCSRHGLRQAPGEPLLCSDCAARRARGKPADREPVALGAS